MALYELRCRTNSLSAVLCEHRLCPYPQSYKPDLWETLEKPTGLQVWAKPCPSGDGKWFSGGKSGATALWTEVLLSSFLRLPHANYSCNEDILLEKLLEFIYNTGNLLPATSWCTSNTKEEQGACRSQARQQVESSCHWIVLGRFGPSVLPFGVSIRCINPAANLQLGKQRHRGVT